MGAPAGIRFGNYELIKRLAHGGMAEVFLARQRGPQGFDRRVAIKRVLPHLADSEDFLRMFLEEARLVASLNHPNVVHIYELGRVEEHYFITMEYIDGVHAGEIIEREAGPRMPVALVARAGADACAGLNYVHHAVDAEGKHLRLVHRDISPPNLMISYDGVVKLMDFGIAKATGQMDLTRPGVVKGKFAYMSPEQTMGQPLDGRSDVFSLSLILWEMLAGQVALPRTDPVMAMMMIRDGKIRPIDSVRPDVPPGLAAVLQRGLAVEPVNRPTAAEMGHELESFIKSSPELGTSMQLSSWVRQGFPRTSAGEDTDDEDLDPASWGVDASTPEASGRSGSPGRAFATTENALAKSGSGDEGAAGAPARPPTTLPQPSLVAGGRAAGGQAAGARSAGAQARAAPAGAGAAAARSTGVGAAEAAVSGTLDQDEDDQPTMMASPPMTVMLNLSAPAGAAAGSRGDAPAGSRAIRQSSPGEGALARGPDPAATTAGGNTPLPGMAQAAARPRQATALVGASGASGLSMSEDARRRLLIGGSVALGVVLVAVLIALVIGFGSDPGDEPAAVAVVLVPGDAGAADALDPGAQAARGPGRLIVVTAPPGAEVVLKGLKGRAPQSAPARFVDLPPGVYQVIIRKDGYQSTQRSVTVKAGQAEDLVVTLEPAGTP